MSTNWNDYHRDFLFDRAEKTCKTKSRLLPGQVGCASGAGVRDLIRESSTEGVKYISTGP